MPTRSLAVPLTQATDLISGVPRDDDPNAWRSINDSLWSHLRAGTSVAIYQNVDLSHQHVGNCIGITFGTPEAQIEGPEPPEQMPDGIAKIITGGVNWRYRLHAVLLASGA
jgi:hypothetical protein